MRKSETIDLELLDFGNSRYCRDHPSAPFFRHLDPDGWEHEGCWDCSVPFCGQHIHESEAQSQRWGERIIPEREALKAIKEAGEIH